MRWGVWCHGTQTGGPDHWIIGSFFPAWKERKVGPYFVVQGKILEVPAISVKGSLFPRKWQDVEIDTELNKMINKNQDTEC